MIVSASYNDDIPAFYGRWFMKRLDAGYCRTFDSNGLQFHRVALTPDTVKGFVFWTRRATPFLAELEEIRRRGFAFVVQYGVNEDSTDAACDMQALSAAYGPRCAVWRYAPATRTREAYLRHFAGIANKLRGTTDEVTVSLRQSNGGASTAETRPLMKELAGIARDCRMRLSICSQPDCLVPGASPARCIDARRLSELARRPIAAATHPKWSGCLCAAAYDIGTPSAPGSAGSACASMALRRDDHDPDGEFLAPPPSQFEIREGADLPF